MKCKVCGTKFKPKKEDKYIVKVTKRTSMVTADIETYDAFDCPKCGCQQLAGLRHLEIPNVFAQGTRHYTQTHNTDKSYQPEKEVI